MLNLKLYILGGKQRFSVNLACTFWNEFPSVNIYRCIQADWLFSCDPKLSHLQGRGVYYWAFSSDQIFKIHCVLRDNPHSDYKSF